MSVPDLVSRGHIHWAIDGEESREKGGENDRKVLGDHGRDVLNENDKLYPLLGSAEDNKLYLLNTFI